MFAFDTNPCVEVLRARPSLVTARYRAMNPRQIHLPSIVAAELLVGAEKSGRASTRAEVETLLAAHDIIPFGEREMRLYAAIRAHLETAGNKISDNDLIVAATALASGLTLVTHNVREFSRVPGLSLVDWQV